MNGSVAAGMAAIGATSINIIRYSVNGYRFLKYVQCKAICSTYADLSEALWRTKNWYSVGSSPTAPTLR